MPKEGSIFSHLWIFNPSFVRFEENVYLEWLTWGPGEATKDTQRATDSGWPRPGGLSWRISAPQPLIHCTWGWKFNFSNPEGVGITAFCKLCISTKVHPERQRLQGHLLGTGSAHVGGRERDTFGNFPVVNLPNSCFQYAGDLGKQSKIIPRESRSHGYEKTCGGRDCL